MYRWTTMGVLSLALAACANTPEQLAYRQRAELGILAPQDVQRFSLSDRAVLAYMDTERTDDTREGMPSDAAWFDAVQAGDLEAVKKYIAQGKQRVNRRDASGRSALGLAALQGNVALARVLLKAGAKVDGMGEGLPPLSAAALRGHAEMVRLLLRSGAEVDAVAANGQVPLVDAVHLNHVDVALALLQAGASRRSVDRSGDNLLLIAIDKNSVPMLQALLQYGVPSDLRDSNGLTPLYWAEFRQRGVLADLLRKAGADPEHRKAELVLSRDAQQGDW